MSEKVNYCSMKTCYRLSCRFCDHWIVWLASSYPFSWSSWNDCNPVFTIAKMENFFKRSRREREKYSSQPLFHFATYVFSHQNFFSMYINTLADLARPQAILIEWEHTYLAICHGWFWHFMTSMGGGAPRDIWRCGGSFVQFSDRWEHKRATNESLLLECMDEWMTECRGFVWLHEWKSN